MDHEPEHIERMYFVRVLCPIKKKWYKTRYRMTEDTAKSHFPDQQYEILWDTLEERQCGGNPERHTTSAALRGVKV